MIKQKTAPGQADAAMPLWAIVAAAGLISAVTVGLRQVVGLYMPSVTQSLGIGLSPFSTAMAVANLIWGIVGVFAGAFADRFGAGRITAVGIALMMLGYYIMFAATTGGDLMWSGVSIGTGVGACGLSVMVGVVGRAAPAEHRTAAIASLGVASGIGNFVAFPYTHFAIELLGWKASILAVIATLGLLLPCAWMLRGRPAAQMDVRSQSLGAAFDEAFRLPSFWLLVVGYSVCGFHVAFYSTHLPAYVASQGLPPWAAIWALTAVGISNIVGTYLAGHAARYIEKRLGLTIIYLARILVFLGLLYLPADPLAIIALSSMLGLFWLATIPLTSGLVATFFGTTWLSMLFGLVLLSHQAGSFVGVWAAGILYDMTGSYEAMWKISIALSLVAALLHLPIKERPVARLVAAAEKT